MPSITAQNLGQVAASADNSQANRGASQARHPTQQAQAPKDLITQIQATAAIVNVKKDKERTPLVNKEIDAKFATQEDKPKTKKRIKKNEQGQAEVEMADNDHIDVIA
jgi:hypothetical protein